jgi:hypothetical protein
MDYDPSMTNGAHAHLLRTRLRTPRAAAIAGIIFALLLICSLWLLLRSVPTNPFEAGTWLESSSESVTFALNLVPFTGVAFLWFIGVLRDRLGAMEDQLFATVFLGSGVLFLGMLFVAAAAIGGIILAHSVRPTTIFDSGTFAFARAFTFDIMQIYAFKMAAVFMMSASTLAIRTHFTPRWIALLGYASAVFLLIGSSYVEWALFVFPIWVMLVSGYILIDNLASASRSAPSGDKR